MESLDKHFRAITRSAFERYGFAHGELAAHWRDIVGEDIARRCAPEKMVWPRGRDGGRQQIGATLSVRCDDGEGLALSYETGRIREKVNTFYGYQAVAMVKIVQGRRKPETVDARHDHEATDATRSEVADRLGHIEDANLKQALARLGEGVLQTSKCVPNLK